MKKLLLLSLILITAGGASGNVTKYTYPCLTNALGAMRHYTSDTLNGKAVDIIGGISGDLGTGVTLSQGQHQGNMFTFSGAGGVNCKTLNLTGKTRFAVSWDMVLGVKGVVETYWSIGHNRDYNHMVCFGDFGGGTNTLAITNGAFGNRANINTSQMVVGEYHHYVVCVNLAATGPFGTNRDKVQIYQDGVNWNILHDSLTAGTAFPDSVPTSTTDSLYIGGGNVDYIDPMGAGGEIDEWCYFPDTLTPHQVMQLYVMNHNSKNIIALGQSNGTVFPNYGRADGNPIVYWDNPLVRNVKGEFELKHLYGFTTTDNRSLYPALGDSIAALYTNCPVVFVSGAKGGQGLVPDTETGTYYWGNSNRATPTDTTGANWLYGKMMQSAWDIGAGNKSTGGPICDTCVPIYGLVFVGGEKEAGSPYLHRDTVRQWMDTLHSRIQRDLKQTIPIWYNIPGRIEGCLDSAINNVRVDLINFADSTKLRFIGNNSFPNALDDGVHYTPTEQNKCGSNFSHMIARYFGLRSGNYKWPTISALSKTQLQVKTYLGSYSLPSPTNSYSNYGGSGNRQSNITVSITPYLRMSASGSENNLVDGNTTTSVFYFNVIALPGSGNSVLFNFHRLVNISEIKWYQDAGNYSQGNWNFQGTNDSIGAGWHTLNSSPFTINCNPTSPQTITINTNADYDSLYRIIGVSGATSGATPYVKEIEFKTSGGVYGITGLYNGVMQKPTSIQKSHDTLNLAWLNSPSQMYYAYGNDTLDFGNYISGVAVPRAQNYLSDNSADSLPVLPATLNIPSGGNGMLIGGTIIAIGIGIGFGMWGRRKK
jgi:hypothetical protein